MNILHTLGLNMMILLNNKHHQYIGIIWNWFFIGIFLCYLTTFTFSSALSRQLSLSLNALFLIILLVISLLSILPLELQVNWKHLICYTILESRSKHEQEVERKSIIITIYNLNHVFNLSCDNIWYLAFILFRQL